MREVILRNHEMVEAKKALTMCLENSIDISNQPETQLSLKLTSTRTKTLKTYDELYRFTHGRFTPRDSSSTTNSADIRPSTLSADDSSNNNAAAQQAMQFFTQMFRTMNYNPTNRFMNRGAGSGRGSQRGRSKRSLHQ